MESILFLAHTESDGSLSKIALEALTTAAELASSLKAPLSAALFGAEVVANAIAGCGAARILGAAGTEFAQTRYASDAAAVEALCRAAGATLVIAPATSRWRACCPASRID